MIPPIHSRLFLLSVLSIIAAAATAQEGAAKGPAIQFKKHTISSRFIAEGVAAGDVNRDGRIDILAGNYWFEAPAWKAHLLHADTVGGVPGYSTSFLNFCMDVNNDGWPDLIRFDQPGGVCAWYENPHDTVRLWPTHIILNSAGIENPAFVDVDKDGRMDLICNDTLTKQVIWLQSPVAKGDTAWQRHIISRESGRGTDRYTHGLGWGDINGDGRNDVLIKSGWWESPVNIQEADWTFHAADLGDDCANMLVLDADGNGDADVISSSAHKYGIWWHEQVKDEKGSSTWVTHEISTLFSQSHALVLEDMNGDGHPDLITGKRYLAHQDGHDPGSYEPAVLYWFEYLPGKKPQWIAHEIDANSGIGNRFVVMDINKDKRMDIVTSNKKGVYFFEQLTPQSH